MDKVFRVMGGRKFLLTVGTIAVGVVIDLLGGGLSTSLASLIGAVVAAFCASNWLNSREYHKMETEKKKAIRPKLPDNWPDMTQLEKKINKITESLEKSDDTEYYINSLEQINQSLGEVIVAQANIMETTQATHKNILAAMQVGKK